MAVPYTTPEDVLKLGDPDPEMTAYFKANPNDLSRFYPDWSSPETGRKEDEPLAAIFEALGQPGNVVDVPMRDGFKSATRIYTPAAAPASGKIPLIVLLYGGAFVAGDNRQLAQFALGLNGIYGATVVLPSYRRAPEHIFPTAPHDILDTLDWLTGNAAAKDVLGGADPAAGFILGGASAGGNLTSAVAQVWHDSGRTPKMTGQWLLFPYLFKDRTAVPERYRDVFLAHEQNKETPVISGSIFADVARQYKPDYESPEFSALKGPAGGEACLDGLKGQRVFLQACGLDPLRDDTIIWHRLLEDHGVESKLHVYPGVPHGHMGYMPFLKQSTRAVLDVLQGFGWLLRTQAPSDEVLLPMLAPS